MPIARNTAFIELNRTFRELLDERRGDDGIEETPIYRSQTRLTWQDLFHHYRVVLLSEAGTGKTAELRHAAQILRNEGKAAFFIRLEHIAHDFEIAFEIGTYDEFTKWLASGGDAWLFLDSVDEARLRHPRDFELAVRTLSRRIAVAIQRVHILISGRISAWRPNTDLRLFADVFPHGEIQAARESGSNENDATSLKDERQSDQQLEKRSSRAQLVVSLDDLNTGQVNKFAAANGVVSPQAFVEGIERADAWSFAARPQDLIELSEFWKDHGRIGSRFEIMNYSISYRLSESCQSRAEARPLSPTRARDGAKLIAAATTLSRKQNIRVPDGAEVFKGIAVAEILPDWDDNERAALLSRPLFDESVYGTVRFHHSSVREFLAAEWLAELLKKQASRRKIESLIFRNQYGIEVVVPSMRPILPWLAILDDKICQRLSKVKLELLLDGGDPQRLPLGFRKRVLREVCEKIASDVSHRNIGDYRAVQRFSNIDIAAEVKSLVAKYAANDDVLFFLIRMVWLGELKDALPEAMRVATRKSLSKHTRISAFRAVRAVGAARDVDDIRKRFLNEGNELNRELLAELVDSLAPTPSNVKWLMDCISKTCPNEYRLNDQLADAVEGFIKRCQDDTISLAVDHLNKLLSVRPVYERRNCEISIQFGWLIKAAAIAVDLLVRSRHAAALGSSALDILHKTATVQGNQLPDGDEVRNSLSALVPDWPELNCAIFWHSVAIATKKNGQKHGERLTEFWQVASSYWRFDVSDIQYFINQVADRVAQVERELALSLAFRLYVSGGRRRPWLHMLKKAASGNDAICSKLSAYLHPPTKHRRTVEQFEATLKRRQERRQKDELTRREKWCRFLQANLELVAGVERERAVVTNAQAFLLNEMRRLGKQDFRWTDGNWHVLAAEFGEDVAQSFRGGVVQFWRGYRPELPSEGAPHNSVPYLVVFGLTGLQVEATEVPGWPVKLNAVEAELACRYAVFEMNGFPSWFSVLYATHKAVVQGFLIREARFELASDRKDIDRSYILSDISEFGQWAWDDLAPHLYQMLADNEPANVASLRRLLKIVQGSALSDDAIAELASKKVGAVKQRDHLPLWLAVWMGVDPVRAIAELRRRLKSLRKPSDRTLFAMNFVTFLQGGHRLGVSYVRGAYRVPKFLKDLYVLMNLYIRVDQDIDRTKGGAYTPGLRDEAQDARNSLAVSIQNCPGKDAFVALAEISKAHPQKEFRSWFAHLANNKAEADADSDPWSTSQVMEFHRQLDRTPGNHRELADLVQLRLLDLKDDLERGDSSVAVTLRKVTSETEMRKFIGRELREKAMGRYSIPQEEELADAKKPDLRFHCSNFDGPVPCELKLADNWSGGDLFERMENQLCGDYLRDNRSVIGVFLLVYRGQKKLWKIPGAKKPVNFEGLVKSLERFWDRRSIKFTKVESIAVVGIDLTKRST